MTWFNFEEMIKSWMGNPAEFISKIDNSYQLDPFFVLAVVLCRLYGLPNCTLFKSDWAPLAHHILTIGESFNWVQILSVVLKDANEKYKKNSSSRNPSFYLSGYVMDVLYATSSFPMMGWNWTRTSPLVHIYYSVLWEDKFVPKIYEICDHFIGSIY